MPRNRFFIKLSYLGDGFYGWQIQPGNPTIQETIELTISTLLREEIKLTGAGRTDTGVHASTFYAHFDTMHNPENLETTDILYKANRMLPPGIALHELFQVPHDAHARFHASSRTYRYLICTRKDPFWANRAWLFERPLSLDPMTEACKLLLTHKDFACFVKSNTQNKTNICSITEARWEREGHLISFTIQADRFLRNMVRAIVGTMVDLGLGKQTPGGFERIILSKNRSEAGYSAPACGLYLSEITYPKSIVPSKTNAV